MERLPANPTKCASQNHQLSTKFYCDTLISTVISTWDDLFVFHLHCQENPQWMHIQKANK